VQISASGMQAAQRLFALHAHNIARVTTDPLEAQSAPDLVADVVGLISAKTLYAANAKAFWLSVETERALLDVRA
jgi:hypothetical protein